jgi:hypothetical protein
MVKGKKKTWGMVKGEPQKGPDKSLGFGLQVHLMHT